MRKDMSKVLVERPRIKDYSDKKHHDMEPQFHFSLNTGWVDDDEDDVPFSGPISLRKPHRAGFRGKQLNENLKPLLRFLERSVGKNWNKVYSEIRENINPNNAVQMHIIQHLHGYVDKYEGESTLSGHYWTKIFFVDNQGVLRKYPKKVKPEKTQNPDFIFQKFIFPEYKTPTVLPAYVKIDDLWFQVNWKTYFIKVEKHNNPSNDFTSNHKIIRMIYDKLKAPNENYFSFRLPYKRISGISWFQDCTYQMFCIDSIKSLSSKELKRISKR